jgi:hypothetical protein
VVQKARQAEKAQQAQVPKVAPNFVIRAAIDRPKQKTGKHNTE